MGVSYVSYPRCVCLFVCNIMSSSHQQSPTRGDGRPTSGSVNRIGDSAEILNSSAVRTTSNSLSYAELYTPLVTQQLESGPACIPRFPSGYAYLSSYMLNMFTVHTSNFLPIFCARVLKLEPNRSLPKFSQVYFCPFICLLRKFH